MKCDCDRVRCPLDQVRAILTGGLPKPLVYSEKAGSLVLQDCKWVARLKGGDPEYPSERSDKGAVTHLSAVGPSQPVILWRAGRSGLKILALDVGPWLLAVLYSKASYDINTNEMIST